MIKDEQITNGEFYSGYTDGQDNSLYFDKGKLEATAYSYEISTSGTVELNSEQTFEVYKIMKKYYENNELERVA